MTNPIQMFTKETRSPGFVSYYSNFSKMRLSPIDMSIVFSRTSQPPGSEASNEEICEFSLSPAHFKQIARQMMAALDAYEQTFGNIPSVGNPAKAADAVTSGIAEMLKASNLAVAESKLLPARKKSAKTK